MAHNMISDEEYSLIQNQLTTLGALITELDIEGFLDRIRLAESVGPILDPSLWIRGNKNLEKIRELAEAMLKVKTTVIRLRKG